MFTFKLKSRPIDIRNSYYYTWYFQPFRTYASYDQFLLFSKQNTMHILMIEFLQMINVLSKRHLQNCMRRFWYSHKSIPMSAPSHASASNWNARDNPPSFNILINPNPYTSCDVPILPNHIIVLTNSNPYSHREPKTYVNLRPPREKIEGRARVMFNKIHVLVMLRSKKSCPEEEEIRTTETMPETLGQNYILIYGWWLWYSSSLTKVFDLTMHVESYIQLRCDFEQLWRSMAYTTFYNEAAGGC